MTKIQQVDRLTGSHQRTFNTIFHHPVAHNLQWRAVRSLLIALADDVQENLASLKVTRNGQTVVLHPPRGKSFDNIDELMNTRHFLERSGAQVQQPTAEGAHLLVVIDHRQARIYRADLSGSLPQRITPYDPYNYGRHLRYVQDDSNGQRRPEHSTYYEAVARTLQDAEKILVFGSGTGASSAMDQLLAELQRRHKDLALRVVGSVVLDQQHLTDDQLLAKAREFYTAAATEAAIT